jgi:hypothetical protein
MAMTFGNLRSKLILLPVVAIAGCAIWVLLPDPSDAEVPAVTPVQTTLAVPAEANAPAEDVAAAPTAPTESLSPQAGAIPEKAPVEGMKISSQTWRRGGLGSKALVTLTLRNANAYDVKDIEIFCSFARRDGSHLTDRKRMIPEALKMKSQKTFVKIHVGFVNVHADKAKCSVLTASRI